MDELDFNRYRPPILKVHMMDADHTILHIVPPTVALQEELRTASDTLVSLLRGGEEDQRKGLISLAARLMSCNRNGITISADELAQRYKLDTADLAIFYDRYVEFLTNIENAKN